MFDTLCDDLSLFRVTAPALESLNTRTLKYDRKYMPATEAFGIFSRICDLFGRLFLNLRSGVFYAFTRDFRRSELVAFTDRNRATVKKMMDSQIRQYPDEMMAFVPTGMIGTYMDMVLLLDSVRNTLDLDPVFKTIESVLSDLENNRATAESIDDATKVISLVDMKVMETGLKKVMSTNQSISERKAIDVIGSKAEDMKHLYTTMLTFEPIYVKAVAYSKQLPTIESGVNKHVAKIRSSVEPNPKLVLALQKFLYMAANQIDLYGQLLHLMQITEHNYCLSLQRIYEYQRTH